MSVLCFKERSLEERVWASLKTHAASCYGKGSGIDIIICRCLGKVGSGIEQAEEKLRHEKFVPAVRRELRQRAGVLPEHRIASPKRKSFV